MTVSVNGNTFTGTISSALSVRAIAVVKYNYYDTKGTAIYDYYDTNYQDGHHLMVDCPYKGMALVVQDKQELDGTLHIGLGKPAGGGGSSSPIIINDHAIPYNTSSSITSEERVEHNTIGFNPASYTTDKLLTIYKDGVFSDIPTSTGTWASEFNWHYGQTGSAVEHFTFGSSNRLIWYTWYCYIPGNYITVEDEPGVTHKQYLQECNPHRTLNLDVDDLDEGVVYEIDIKIRAVGTSSYSAIDDNTTLGFYINFYKNLNTNPSTQNVYRWAEDVSCQYYIQPIFQAYVPPTDTTAEPPAPLYNSNVGPSTGKPDRILGESVVHFTKVDGKVYIMSY